MQKALPYPSLSVTGRTLSELGLMLLLCPSALGTKLHAQWCHNGAIGLVTKIMKTQQHIVFVWSQYDGANIEQLTVGYGWRQNQKVKLKIVGGEFTCILQTRSWSNHSLYNICNYAITFSIVLTSTKAYYPEALYQFITNILLVHSVSDVASRMGPIWLLVQETALFTDQTLFWGQDRALFLLARFLHQNAHFTSCCGTFCLPIWSCNCIIKSKLPHVSFCLNSWKFKFLIIFNFSGFWKPF